MHYYFGNKVVPNIKLEFHINGYEEDARYILKNNRRNAIETSSSMQLRNCYEQVSWCIYIYIYIKEKYWTSADRV